jgi:hypothetical protein
VKFLGTRGEVQKDMLGTISGGTVPQSWACTQETPEQRRCAYMTALLLPLRGVNVPLKKGKSEPLIATIVLKSLKWSKVDSAMVQLVQEELPELHRMYQAIQGVVLCEARGMCQCIQGVGSPILECIECPNLFRAWCPPRNLPPCISC